MINITFPDGRIKQYAPGVLGKTIAHEISPGLLKKTLVIEVDGEQWDLTREIHQDSKIRFITIDDEDGLEVLRHDAAHVLAQAAKELYPEIQVTIGPAIENGFYYDFYRETPFTPEDLVKMEKRMREIVVRNEEITREVWNRDEAVKYFTSIGEHFKAEIISSIPQEQDITLYRQGGFLDLCRGPHLMSTARLGSAFKLMKLAGAYWRGDSKNPMLQRVYGTAWAKQEQLDAYLYQLEEAEKRDHRKLGREMDLFHLQEEAVGSVFWHDKGWTVYRLLQQYIRTRIKQQNYIEVNTPVLVDRALWEASGHWEKYRDGMFITQTEDKTLAVKPMNCPCHIQIFKQGLKSYRDLPIRMAEFGSCYRNEPSGALHGIMRVRSFVQDDAHIFCTQDQITSEVIDFCQILKTVYNDLGFDQIKVKFSPRPEVRAGDDETWDKAEEMLRQATTAAGIEYSLNPGEGAFYGPKLEFTLKDALGREWQCGTLQVDYILPERLDASYIGEDGKKHRPVMLHRAILGSLERFMGMLIEHYAGKFPLWLAPVQIVVATITGDADVYANEVLKRFQEAGIRAQIDLRNEKISYKVREHSLQKVPFICVVGKSEAENQTVALRKLGGESQEILSLKDALLKIQDESKPPVKLI